MGRCFHVIEQRVGADIIDLRQGNGRLRECAHFRNDRRDRLARIRRSVGFGHVVRQCLVDTGHPAGYEIHALTDTGVVVVVNARSHRLVTMLVARPAQVRRYYEPFGEEVPRELLARAYRNTRVHHWNR